MSRVLVVTSAPPLTEGGHLVLARALVQALRASGHEAGLVTTPSNRFGRQGPAYLANWLTDVGMTGSRDRVNQIVSLRFRRYLLAQSHHLVCGARSLSPIRPPPIFRLGGHGPGESKD